MDKARILVVDDEETARKNLSRLLSREGCDVTAVKGAEEALAQLARKRFDLVITDLVMGGMSGMDLLERIKTSHQEVEVIVVTGYASISTAIEAIKAGAYHYLEKPFRPDEVRNLVRHAVEKKRLHDRVLELESQIESHPEEPAIIGESREMREVVGLVEQVAQADCNVVITGESGVGKELAASLIHYRSRRSKNNFLAINCGGFAEDLLANELFGHVKGAFTGATTDRPGLLETASGGTLLLDEIGDMPISMQVKLLRAVQEQEVIRVGGNKPIPIDVRIIAATNQDLKKAVSARLFRNDLFYRLNVISIDIPPLRKRKKDIPLLANFFLNRAAKKSHKAIEGYSDQAMSVLIEYDYPGNVRELENIVERAVAMARENLIQVSDLPSDLSEMEVFSFDKPDSEIKTLKELEREYIQWVLNKVGRNKTEAAKRLGINRASLWRHLKRHEIED